MAPPSIPEYRDLRLIGRGGFAEVYAAVQPAFGDRLVAVKVLTVDELDEDRQRRFERECHAAGRISWHPNVVNVYDAGTTDDGRPYLVMEHLRRGALSDLVASGPISWQEAVALAIPVAGALEAAHRADLVHRDVKPANVLIGPLDEPKLADFGIARVAGSTTSRTQGVQATLAHASPEALEGEAGPASDVYALASTLYELVAGSPAFVQPGDETITPVIARIMASAPPDLRPRGVPDSIATAIEQAMAKDPSARPATAEAFGQRLQSAAGSLGQPPVRMLTSLEDAPARPPAPGPTSAAASPVATEVERPAGQGSDAGGGADGGGGETVHLHASSPPPPSPPGPAAPAPGSPTQGGGRSRRTLVLAGLGALVVGLLLAGAVFVATRDDGADDQARTSSGSSTSQEASEDGTEDLPTPGVPGAVDSFPAGLEPLGVAVADGIVYVADSGDDTLTLLDEQTGAATTRIDAPGRPRRMVAAADDGVWITFSDAGELGKANADGIGQRLPVGGQPIGVAEGFGSVWVTSSADASVTRISLDAQETEQTISGLGGDLRGVATGEGAVWVTDLAGTEVLRIDPDATGDPQRIEVGDGPGSVAVGEGAVWVANTRAGTVARIDPDSLEVTTTIDVGTEPVAVVVGAGSVWVANQSDDTVMRIDPATDEVVDTVTVGSRPGAIAVTDSAVWVSNVGGDSVSRITLD